MHDLVVVGAGPAGLTASIYASCYGLKHVVIGKLVGGQLNLAPDILNFPGFKNINGTEIIKNQGGVKEYNKLLKFNDFEKIKKDKQRFWQQYSDIKRPRTIYSYLKGKSKLKEEQINKRKIKMGLDKN